MARGFSYIVARDYGFAPNPFYGVLTLATCKPSIRKTAMVGDYVIGFSRKKYESKLIFMMRVTEKMSFDEYWNDPRFLCKRPVMNGSTKKLYGDNIYHHDELGQWVQEDSHHSKENGEINEDNLKKDTRSTDQVLISSEFFYLGNKMVKLPSDLRRCVYEHRGHKKIDEKDCLELWKYLTSKYKDEQLIGLPRQFKSFKRYDGKS
jgi:hypothetical protein